MSERTYHQLVEEHEAEARYYREQAASLEQMSRRIRNHHKLDAQFHDETADFLMRYRKALEIIADWDSSNLSADAARGMRATAKGALNG